MRAITGTVAGIAAVIAIAAATMVPLPAAAAQPQRVPGIDCRTLAGHKNMWQTTFWGWKIDVFGFRQELRASPCFTSEANCKAWLYWARSDYDPNYVPPKLCHRIG